MDTKKKMEAVREAIDDIDGKIVALFGERMALSDKVAYIKKDGNLSITDDAREKAVVERAVALSGELAGEETGLLMRSLMALSKLRQRKLLYGEKAGELLPPPRTPQRKGAVVAYQGLPGAWGEQAVVQLFEDAQKETRDSFEDVFAAVKDNKALYGVVPIENSQTGAIGEVYDLLRRYGCYIVDQTWVEVRHCLLALPGTNLNDIREVFSHPEGFRQCEQFLRNRSWDMTACSNTANAAEKVSKSGDRRFAAIGSRRAAELYGLEVIAPDIASDQTNRTRFIVIAAEPEYDETCNAVSVIFRTAHRSGALCEVLFPFMAGNVNLSRIESRPMTGGKYCFFCDLAGNIGDPMIASALRHAAVSCGHLEVLGCYHE